MKHAVVFLSSVLACAQVSTIRKEHWGMTPREVIQAKKAAPVRRTPHSLFYRDKKAGVPVQMVFQFTDGKLDALSYVLDSLSQNPELVFLNWCLELTKRCGKGMVYLNKQPVGPPGIMLDESLKEFWKQTSGEILVVYQPEGITNVAVGITLHDGLPLVEMDFAATPKEQQ